MNNDYEVVVGLEIHAQMSTQSKAFCADGVAFGASPNTLVSPISLGHPGTLPRTNARHVEYAVRLGLATHCAINRENRFARKHYFYPDLPKGYQISQDHLPICQNGYVEIRVAEETKRVRVRQIHLEEDAGKLVHDEKAAYSLLDLNRAGTPLLEMVSEPDLRSAEEVMAYIVAVRQLVRYLGICDGNMEEGSLRCDVNVSVRKRGAEAFGTRCEVKNVNSVRNAGRATVYEASRQIALIESGGVVEQQTRAFDADRGITLKMRGKEDAHDYRYFPEPDLPPVRLTEAFLEKVRGELPPMPDELFGKCVKEYGLTEYDAGLLTEDIETAQYFLHILEHTPNYKAAANWLLNTVKATLKDTQMGLEDFPLVPMQIGALIQLVDAEKVSNTAARHQLYPALLAAPQTMEIEELAKTLQLIQVQDTDALEALAAGVLAAFPEQVKEYRQLPSGGKGKKRKTALVSLFMGELMKQSKGKADPKIGTAMLLKLLERP